MTVPSSEPRSLGDAAYQRLRADIVSCRLAPGERLTERSLVERTGLGMSPVRDALTRLDHEGLVRTLPRKGYQVTPLTLKSVDDLFTLWRIIGPEIARLGLRDASMEQHRRIVEAFTELAQLSNGDANQDPDLLPRLIELADTAFATLAEGTQNDYLLSIFRRLQNDMARIWVLIGQADARVPHLVVDDQWTRIAERRDGDAAAAAVQRTIAAMHAQALRIFSRWPSVAASEITPLSR